MVDSISREDLLDCVLDVMEVNKREHNVPDTMNTFRRRHGSCFSVPRISFVESNGSTALQNNRVIYSIGMPCLPETVDVNTAANLVVQAKREGRHAEQLIDLFNDGQHDLMLVDWLSDKTGPIFYNFNMHEDLCEWDAYHEGLVQARPILVSWFDKDLADAALLDLYMDLARDTDTVYFTKEKRSDYVDLDTYVSDMEDFGKSLYHTRTRIDAREMYGLNSRVRNTDVLVKDFSEDWYQDCLYEFGNINKLVPWYFLITKNAFDQRRIVAGFMSLDGDYAYVIPRIADVNFIVQVPRWCMLISSLVSKINKLIPSRLKTDVRKKSFCRVSS